MALHAGTDRSAPEHKLWSRTAREQRRSPLHLVAAARRRRLSRASPGAPPAALHPVSGSASASPGRMRSRASNQPVVKDIQASPCAGAACDPSSCPCASAASCPRVRLAVVARCCLVAALTVLLTHRHSAVAAVRVAAAVSACLTTARARASATFRRRPGSAEASHRFPRPRARVDRSRQRPAARATLRVAKDTDALQIEPILE